MGEPVVTDLNNCFNGEESAGSKFCTKIPLEKKVDTVSMENITTLGNELNMVNLTLHNQSYASSRRSGKKNKLKRNEKTHYDDSAECVDDDLEDAPPGPEAPLGLHFLWAAQTNKIDMLQNMLFSESNLLGFADEEGYTALHRACYSNHANVTHWLLIKGAKVNAVTLDGWQPIHCAARWNAAACLEQLLWFGASVNAQTVGGQTPLHLAVFHGQAFDVLQLLLMQDNVDGSLTNCQGDTAVMLASRKSRHVWELFNVLTPAFNDIFDD